MACLLGTDGATGGRHVHLEVVDISHLMRERAEVLTQLVLTNAAITLILALVGYLAVKRMVRPLRVLALTANPFRAPQSYQPKVFFRALAEAVGSRAPVFDVVSGLASLPGGDGAGDDPVPASRRKVLP